MPWYKNTPWNSLVSAERAGVGGRSSWQDKAGGAPEGNAAPVPRSDAEAQPLQECGCWEGCPEPAGLPGCPGTSPPAQPAAAGRQRPGTGLSREAASSGEERTGMGRVRAMGEAALKSRR